MAASYLGDKAVNAEAATTVMHLGRHLRKSHGEDVIAAMRKVVATSKNPKTVEQARKYLEDRKK